MLPDIPRRRFLGISTAALGSLGLGVAARGRAAPGALAEDDDATEAVLRGKVFKSVKLGMFNERIPLVEKLRILKSLGYDGVETDSPGGPNKEELLAASRELDFPVHGAVDSIHWGVRLSDPSEETRQRALEGLITAIRETHQVGGTAVLLVPGRVSDPEKENQEQVWERSIAQIRKALPTAARLGIHILIENVWNGFCYIHDGPSNQSADRLAEYIDAIDSPWVGSYFDIGNHQKYGKPAEWIRTLGKRIVKLDVKDWGVEAGFSKIGDGDVDWAAVREALVEIGFTGWATAEVRGGDRGRMAEVAERMDRVLGL